MKWEFEWANGKEVCQGKTYQNACANIKTSPDKILTGFLVRVRKHNPKSFITWEYWDAEQFWKHLKKKEELGSKEEK